MPPEVLGMMSEEPSCLLSEASGTCCPEGLGLELFTQNYPFTQRYQGHHTEGTVKDITPRITSLEIPIQTSTQEHQAPNDTH